MSQYGHEPDETNPEPVLETCQQCRQDVIVRWPDDLPPGPFICDTCFDRTMRREASRMAFSDHLLDTAVLMARVRR